MPTLSDAVGIVFSVKFERECEPNTPHLTPFAKSGYIKAIFDSPIRSEFLMYTLRVYV
jgi:hypothetical protein